MKVDFKYELSPAWELIEKVEENTNELFNIQDKDLKHDTLMVISELLENAVKYGKSNPQITGIQFRFYADDNKIIIKVSNGVVARKHVDDVILHIKKVNASDNPEILYTNRLQELLDSRKTGESKLGIFRISYEGQFKLFYEYKNEILTITAEREYGKGDSK